ncbi:universal stress protein [Streptomyces sp. NPDC051776]|uniref:universal stress protein n=1 Tax=Streptomyces sp. NPDC051776 TaxID=3155414 RepID=UPI0034141AB6
MSHLVVAGIDGSECSLAAADWAAREAALRDVPLRLVHASPPLPGIVVPVAAADTWHEIGERMLQHAVADLTDRYPDIEVRGEQITGTPAETLLAAAPRHGLLVVGARGSGGFGALAVGSVALRVGAAAHCPVVMVPKQHADADEEEIPANGDAGQLVLGFAAHHPVNETADFAFSAAQARGARLRVVHAWALPADCVSPRMLAVTEEDRAEWEDQEVLQLTDALSAWREKYYPEVTVRTDVVLLHPAEALLNTSRGADLLVVGRRTDPLSAEGGLGPVAHAVLHHTRCPVAVVPHAD